MARLLGILGLLPGLLIVSVWALEFHGFSDRPSGIDRRLVPAIAISMLSFVLIIPSIEQRLTRRSDNHMISFFKAMLLLIISGLIAMSILAVLSGIVRAFPELKVFFEIFRATLFGMFLILSIAPGHYAIERRSRFNREAEANANGPTE